MSYWGEPRPVLRSRAVTIVDLARASADVLDEDGVEALTVRRVAALLGVAPPSLYSRIQSVEDLLDLALDHALGEDEMVRRRCAGEDPHELLLALYDHLCRHPWASQVIGRRPPRGPAYLHLSERLCVLLTETGAGDPLTTAYALSNFVIGSAITQTSAATEPVVPVDPAIAPTYARLHRAHDIPARVIVDAGLRALRQGLRADRGAR